MIPSDVQWRRDLKTLVNQPFYYCTILERLSARIRDTLATLNS
jgi:hypothetical protein